MTWRNLNDKGWDRLRAGLAAGDRDGEIAAVWLARELLSEVSNAHGLAHAKRRLIVFFQHATADVPELTRLARTVDRWSNEVLAYHQTGGTSNGPTEAVIIWSLDLRQVTRNSVTDNGVTDLEGGRRPVDVRSAEERAAPWSCRSTPCRPLARWPR